MLRYPRQQVVERGAGADIAADHPQRLGHPQAPLKVQQGVRATNDQAVPSPERQVDHGRDHGQPIGERLVPEVRHRGVEARLLEVMLDVRRAAEAAGEEDQARRGDGCL